MDRATPSALGPQTGDVEDVPASPDVEDDVRAEAHRLHARLREADEVARELREAVDARNEFIAAAGHELRNPMGAIILSVSNGTDHEMTTRVTGPPVRNTRRTADGAA
jgi:signal transduction histidine kinase